MRDNHFNYKSDLLVSVWNDFEFQQALSKVLNAWMHEMQDVWPLTFSSWTVLDEERLAP